MNRRIVVVVWAVLVAGATARAQEPAYREEMKFVEKMRTEGYSDLALEYLKRLQKNPSPELVRELPLELAKTQMEVAAQEPDSLKRLALYDQAKADFEKFLKANPGHPRAREAQLDVGRVLALRGKTQLSRALMQGGGREREAEAVKARAYLAEAGKKLQEAVETAKDDNDKAKAQLEVALNLLDQAQSYDKASASNDVLLARAKIVQAALDVLKPLATGDSKDPLTWKAMALQARGNYELGEFGKAREQLVHFLGLVKGGVRQAAEGERLARYFLMLLLQEKTEKEDQKLGSLVKQGEAWLKFYGRFQNKPEGYGVRYLLAEEYLKRAVTPKSPTKAADLKRARALLRALERTENEFTDRARQKKLAIVKLQGGFDKKITDLKTFEDSYIRAQYEIWQMGEDAKTAKDADALEKKRQERLASILEALKHGLAQKDATPLTPRGTPNIEYNNAQTMLAFYSWQVADEAWREYTALQAKSTGAAAGGAGKEEQDKLKAEVAAKRKEALGHYEEAIRVGEDFARKNPKSGQATTAAVYALQAYFRVLAGRQAAGAAPEDLKELTGKMTALAGYMETRWPKELAGNMARHLIGMRFYHDKDWPAAVKKLAAITPGYPDFASAHYWLADALFHLHTAAAEQAKDAENKAKEEATPANKQAAVQATARAADLRKQALDALTRVPPPPATADPSVNRMYVLGKLRLLRELYLDKKYPELEAQANQLAPKVATLKFTDDAKADATVRAEFQTSLSQFPLLALMGKADAAFQAKKYADVVTLLDPEIAKLGKGAHPALKANKRLGMALVGMDLKSNVQLGNVAKTQIALKGLEALSDKGGAGTIPIMVQLVGIIEQQLGELRKKNDKKDLDSAIKNFSGILDSIVKRKDTQLTPEFLYLLGKAYASMDKHAEAAKMFEKVPPAKAGDAKREKVYKSARLLAVTEMRKTGDPAQVKKAREMLDEIIGTKAKPGWGLRSLPALKERGLLFEAGGEYVKGAKHFNSLVNLLLKKVGTNTALKEEYLDCYYHMVYCVLKHGQEQETNAKRTKFVREAAAQASQLAKKWEEFGSEASKKRFLDLLAKEPEFKTVFDELSAAK